MEDEKDICVLCKEEIKIGVFEYLEDKKAHSKCVKQFKSMLDLKNNSAAKSLYAFLNRMQQAEIFCTRQPIFYDHAGLWWIWNLKEKHWKIADEIDILNIVAEQTSEDLTKNSSRNEILNALKQHGRKHIPKPAPKTWIQFKNGIVDISKYIKNDTDKDTVNLIEPAPDYFVVNPIPWSLGFNSDTRFIDRLFHDWVGEEYKETLYEIMAYCLLPDYPIHRIFCLIGSGSNGKSSYLELMRKFFGEKNTTSTELDRLISSRFEITNLHKKLVCQMGETNFGELNRTSLLKQLCGNDFITFEYKNKTPFQDKNYAKIIICTNNLPSTTDKTIGFYRRWCIIDFPNQFNERKNVIEDIPETEYENLGFKLINMLKKLLERRKFTNEGTIEERQKKYEERSDPLEKFMKEFTVEDSESFIWKQEFERKLNQWLKENRFREMADTTIGKKMNEKGFIQERRQADWLGDGEYKRYRAWIGIRWKDNIDDSLEKQEQQEQYMTVIEEEKVSES